MIRLVSKTEAGPGPLAERRGRAYFPALQQRPGWTYLDSAATALMHQEVLRVAHEMMARGGSAGRGAHQAGAQASQAYERLVLSQ